MDRTQLWRVLLMPLFALPCYGDLLHHWALDEGTGATDIAVDSAGGLNGVIQGPASAAGKAGKAFRFDGADDTVTIQGFAVPPQGTVRCGSIRRWPRARSVSSAAGATSRYGSAAMGN